MAQRLAEQIYREDQVAALEGLSLEERRRVEREDGIKAEIGKGGGGIGQDGSGMKEGEVREAVYYRLERLGYRVGVGLVERYVHMPYAPPLPGCPYPFHTTYNTSALSIC